MLETEADVRWPKLGPGFLDCGAYSVLTGLWDSLPLDDYAEFVSQHYKQFEILACPDVIGNGPATFENLKTFVHELKRRRVWTHIAKRAAVTYHLGDRDLGLCDEMLDWAWGVGIRWFCVGGIVVPGTSQTERMLGIDTVINLARQRHPTWKVHLFGGYQPELIRLFRPDSVDSATYIAAAKSMWVAGYQGWRMFKAAANRESENTQLDYLMKKIADWSQIPYDADVVRNELRLMPDGIRLWLVNIMGVHHFEEWARKELKKPEFRFWTTIDVTMPQAAMRYGQACQELFWHAWRDRCLVAYPSFWQGPGLRHKHEQTIERMLA